MNKSTIYIIITILLFLVINDPLLKLFSNSFNSNFWFSEVIIAIIVVLLVLAIRWILNKTIFRNKVK